MASRGCAAPESGSLSALAGGALFLRHFVVNTANTRTRRMTESEQDLAQALCFASCR